MTKRILKLPEVIHRTGLSRSSIYAYKKEGVFPSPVKLDRRSVRWIEQDIIGLATFDWSNLFVLFRCKQLTLIV